MGVGAAIGAGSLVICAAVVLVLVGALRASRRAEPAERVWHVWNPTARQCMSGLVWPECSADEYCGCRGCHDAAIGDLAESAIWSAFLGIVIAERAREGAS